MMSDSTCIQEIYLDRTRIERFVEQRDEPLLKHLRAQGDQALMAGPFSVMDKKLTPPSGDKHDFLRMPTYAWPNPDTSDGLPYIIRDGEFGPHINGPDYDQGRMTEFTHTVKALGWAFLATADEQYARQAVYLLRVWFLDESTRMNPNLTYSKFTPGDEPPYPTGVISTHNWVELVQIFGFLQVSESWTDALSQGLRQWFSDYNAWLQSSDQGLAEKSFKNNRGIWYDAQLVAFARFIGDDALAKQVLSDSVPQRLESQLDADGSLPEELRRTNGLTYSLMTLKAYTLLALSGDLLGIDVWHFRCDDGRNLHQAFTYLNPYLENPEDWPYQQIKSAHFNATVFTWLAAAEAYADGNLCVTITRVAEEAVLKDPARLLFEA